VPLQRGFDGAKLGAAAATAALGATKWARGGVAELAWWGRTSWLYKLNPVYPIALESAWFHSTLEPMK
jgi:hypothetical protein